MEILNTLNVPFYKFIADKSLTDKILHKVSNLSFLKSDRLPEQGFTFEDFYDDELFAFFDQSIKEVQSLYYHEHLTFEIVDCWVNKYSKLNKLHRHIHTNSIISGIFYCTTHTTEGTTIFEMENPWFYKNNVNTNLSIYKNYKPLSSEITAEAGTLILFPNSIPHTMKTLVNTTTSRYSIAFNTYPTGPISLNKTSKLEINVISVRDRVKGHQK